MKLTKREGYWYVKIKDATTGRWRRMATGIKDDRPLKDAELAATDVLRKFYSPSTSVTPQSARQIGAIFNMAEALERCYVTKWQATKSDIQLKYVVRRLEREIGHWLLTEIDFNKLEQYQQDILKSGKSAATVNRRMSLIKVTLKHCHQKRDIPAMPAFPETLAENNIKERYLSEAEEVVILDYLKAMMAADFLPHAQPVWTYMRALTEFLIDTGCRLGEALTLTKTDGKVVHLEHGTTKSNKARVIPLTPRAAKSVELMLANSFHGKVDASWVGHRWGLVRRECAVPDVNIHVLRHTCASRLLAAGVDLYVVSKWLGHSSVKITERYGHLAHGALEQAAAALSRGPVPVSASPREPVTYRSRK